ncbi:unnamed protein product [Diatraea saccharalis]|uniref:Uncharacterized protein n=1 Tax=Diatraea saccharalis TaxID=40085 RepID=A0A9N9WJZ9_9NEOP|nr:unnamed protein product [Diatraea saccharalis]
MGLGDILNGIPVIGHAKAGLHALSGDRYEAAEAFKAANRTTVVMAGGAAGAMVGGPAGMIGGAIAAGSAVDGISSVANHRAEGVFDGIKDVAHDITKGKLPIKSVIKTGLYVGSDALSGATGGSIAANIPKEIGKSLVKDAVTVVAKSTTKAMVATAAAGRTTREVAKAIEHNECSGGSSSSGSSSRNSGNSNKNTSSTGSKSSKSNSNSGTNTNKSTNTSTNSGSGGQPPQNNKNNPNSGHQTNQTNTESHFDVFFRLFGKMITSLNDIQIAGVHLFREITSGQPTDRARKNSLKKLIQALRNDGIIERVIETVENIFKQLDRSEVTFANFMYLTEMVASYVTDRLARRHEMQSSRNPQTPFHQRRAENLKIVLKEILEPGSANNILNIFRSLRTHILEAWTNLQPTFASIITAVTHYFKHKFVPASSRVLSIHEYFQLIRSIMPRVLNSPQYGELQAGIRSRLVYDVYRSEFGRRVRIVLQVQNNTIILSSCHILDVIVCFDDKDGNEEFDPTY